jgi:predicted naringenin-chalcone synthase
MFIKGVGTATPPGCFTQAECLAAAERSLHFAALQPRSQLILRKVLTGETGILKRHLALRNLDEAFDMNPDALDARFEREAPALAAAAAQGALSRADISAREVDAVLVSSCTGYLCPGLSGYVSERIGLRSDVLGLDLVGQGCGAALPNLRTADALLASGRFDCVLSVCVEVCSAAMYLDNDPGVLISACLFGDGAAAAVLSNQPNGRKVEWKASGSVCQPADRNLLRFEKKNGMLRNILAREVPEVAARHAEGVLDQLLTEAKVDRSEMAAWIFHPGGRDVLQALRDRLRLCDEDLRWSAEVLRDFGNLSSPSVLFVLQAALRDSAPGGYWWMGSFGAGFTCHGALLEVE